MSVTTPPPRQMSRLYLSALNSVRISQSCTAVFMFLLSSPSSISIISKGAVVSKLPKRVGRQYSCVFSSTKMKILLGFWCCIKRLSSVKSWSRIFIIFCYLYPKFLRSFSFFLQSFFTFTKRLRWIFFAKNFSKSSLASVPTFLIASPLWPIKIPFWVSRST